MLEGREVRSIFISKNNNLISKHTIKFNSIKNKVTKTKKKKKHIIVIQIKIKKLEPRIQDKEDKKIQKKQNHMMNILEELQLHVNPFSLNSINPYRK